MAEYVWMASKQGRQYQAIVLVDSRHVMDVGYGALFDKKTALQVAREYAEREGKYDWDIVRPAR